MATIVHGHALWGMREPLPLEGFPEGRARIVIRPDQWIRIFIKTKTGIREFYPKEENGKWVPYFEKARNERQ